MITALVVALALGPLPSPADPGPSAGLVPPQPRDDDALTRLRAAHRARPEDPEVAAALGLLLYKRDNASPEGRSLLGPVAARFPERHDVQLALLDAHLAAGDAAAASALLDRLEPELDADERFALDTTYCLLGRRRVPEARTQWSRVATRVQEDLNAASGQTLGPEADRELKRRVGEVLFVQGLLTARLGEKDEALELLGRADGLGFPPLDSPLMMVAGDCLYELQEYALAAQAYREVVNHAPEDPEARLRLGVSLFSSGRRSEARDELEQVLRQDPDYPRASYHLGELLLEDKQPEEARRCLERELARDPRCVPCMAKLAHIAYLEGDDRGCESWLQQAAALDPDDQETNLVSGMLETRLGHYQEAIQHLTRVVERRPGSIRAQFQLAIAYQRSGDPERARAHREIYDELIREEKARTLGVRGSED
ncbi:MAG: tetratricopeptide repeat protein [Acidobacteriota bacterium]|jgi:tetratricopeptide (TPR) repeat protein